METKKSVNNDKSEKTKEAMDRFCNAIAGGSVLVWAVTKELWNAAKTKTLPVTNCLFFTIGFCLIRLFRVDERIYAAWGWGPFFLKWTFVFWLYHILGVTASFIAYGFIRAGRIRNITKKLKKVCDGIGLKNYFGETPTFISDYPIDEANRVLRLDRKFISIDEFIKKQTSIGGGLQVHVDEIEEIREDGTISILYSPVPMPSLFPMPEIRSFKDFTFSIGKSRSKELVGDLKKNSHMLIAGESDGGKSTFLRQFITTIYLNNESSEFLLIDLKGNLEFQFFEGLARTTVCANVPEAVLQLQSIEEKIKSRFIEITSIGAKDFADYERIRAQKLSINLDHIVVPKKLSRLLVVIDEAAELFLVSQKTKSAEVRVAREILSQIARQGRALGFHLVFCTQRPDSHTIDPQIKSNLESIISYKIANDASSRTILDNGRASHLPKIPGRAIWKMGGQMTEVQTPLLDISQLQKLIEPLKPVIQKEVTDTKPIQSQIRKTTSAANSDELKR